jgi:ABC-type cobalamin transport system ATPase subunit
LRMKWNVQPQSCIRPRRWPAATTRSEVCGTHCCGKSSMLTVLDCVMSKNSKLLHQHYTRSVVIWSMCSRAWERSGSIILVSGSTRLHSWRALAIIGTSTLRPVLQERTVAVARVCQVLRLDV